MNIATILIAAVTASSIGFEPEDERALADRLFMHWNTHATDVFVRDEAVVGVGGARGTVKGVEFLEDSVRVTRPSGQVDTIQIKP